jgi:hypothetical protein
MIVGAAGKQVLLLWDVDHTLIENSGVSKAVYARAFEMMTGHAAEVQPSTDGRTDYEIVRNLFTANGAAFTAADEAAYQSVLIDHDLRHTGNQLTANAGANPKELMARMGHDSERAALIYLHSSAERQRTLADEVGRMAAAELAKSKTAKPSGTLTAREPNRPDGPADGKSPDLRR